MNPDVLITIAFVGTAVSVALVGLFLVVPRQRRESALVKEHESMRLRNDEPGAPPCAPQGPQEGRPGARSHLSRTRS